MGLRIDVSEENKATYHILVALIIISILSFYCGYVLAKDTYNNKDININKFESIMDDIMMNDSNNLTNPVLYTTKRFIYPDMTLRQIYNFYYGMKPYSAGVAYEVLRSVCE